MALYFEDSTVKITSSWIRIEAAAYPIAEVRYVWHRHSRQSMRGAARAFTRWIIVTLLTLPMVLLALCLIGLPFIRVDGELRVGVLLVGILAGVLVAVVLAPLLEIPLTMLDRIHDRGTEVHEMWAELAGQQILLLTSTDARRFGQIYRAVQRAVEQR